MALQAIVTSQAMENLEKQNNMTYILNWSFLFSADNRLGRGAQRREPGLPVWMLSGQEVVDNSGSDLGDGGKTERSGLSLNSF